MKTRRIEFTEWLPDSREMESPGFVVATDVWPAPNGYAPALSVGTQIVMDAATSGIPLDGAPATKGDGSKFLFVGTTTDLYRLSATSTSTNVSGTTHTTATPCAGGRWDFVQWGEDMIATNWEDPIQRIQDVSATAFAVLSAATATPQCKTLAESRNFLIAGYTFDATDGTSPQRVQWSALNDPTDWVVSAVTQADYHDMLGPGGPVHRVFGGEYAVVFQERAISRMTYVGTPEIWEIDQIVNGQGLFAPGAAAQKENMIFYLSQDGFRVLIDGTRSEPIGRNKVDNFFFESLDLTKKDCIRAVADPSSSRVFWSYPSTSTDLRVEKAIVYDYSTGKWGHQNIAEDPAIVAFANDATGDGVALITWSVSNNQRVILKYLDQTLPGSTNSGQMETSWFQLEPGRSAMMRAIKIGYFQRKAGNPRARITVSRIVTGGDGNADASQSSGSTSVETQKNRYSLRINGLYHKILFTWAGNLNDHWRLNELSHLDVEYVPTHSR